MASVSKEKRNGRTLYRINWRDGDKRRRSLRVSGVSRKDADGIARKVQSLASARISGESLDNAIVAWLNQIGEDLHGKLASNGLVEPRQSATLGVFIDGYIASRQDAEANTVRNWKNSRGKLVEHFGEDADLRSITPAQAHDWRQALVNKSLSEATVSKAVKHAKQFFAVATRRKLCNSNAFADVKAGGEENANRKAFIPLETFAQVLAACPNAEWRSIVALCRLGGLRCPSEVLALEWNHIDWEGERFTVTSRKTKRHGKGWRVVHLFPELAEILREAFLEAPDRAKYVVSRYRAKNSNLRTQFERIIKRANVEPWERLFHNLRASRQTELMMQFPAHVVCDWLGNDEATATRHYLQTTPAHFEQASQGTTAAGWHRGWRQVAQDMATKAAKANRNESQETKTATGVTANMPVFPEALNVPSVPPRGVEPLLPD